MERGAVLSELKDRDSISQRLAMQVCGLKLLVYVALSYWCMKPYALFRSAWQCRCVYTYMYIYA
jgi:hypothetical protein